MHGTKMTHKIKRTNKSNKGDFFGPLQESPPEVFFIAMLASGARSE
jgi:hypothetical protein